MKRTAALLAAVATAGTLTATTLAATPSAAAGPSPLRPAASTWGSLDKRRATCPSGHSSPTSAPVGTPATTGWSSTSSGKVAGYSAGYGAVVEPSGTRVPLRGTDLHVEVLAPAHDGNYRPTYSPADRREAVDVSGFRTFRAGRVGRLLRGPEHDRPGRPRAAAVPGCRSSTAPAPARAWSSTWRTPGRSRVLRPGRPCTRRPGRRTPQASARYQLGEVLGGGVYAAFTTSRFGSPLAIPSATAAASSVTATSRAGTRNAAASATKSGGSRSQPTGASPSLVKS